MLLLVALAALTGCRKKESIWVSTQDLYFGLNAASQTFIVRANCDWSVTKNDDADWYTVSPMSGGINDSIVTVTVSDYSMGDYRGGSFAVNSSRNRVHRAMFVSQNKMEFYEIVNKVYGVMTRERWITDFYDQIIEDEYKHFEYDPYDTVRGYQMYFFEDSVGMQRDGHADTVAWWPFKYWFVPDSLVLHIKFMTENGPESYAPTVLTASDSLYRVFHEYDSHRFERVDMRKVGAIHPRHQSIMQQELMKRKDREALFMD